MNCQVELVPTGKGFCGIQGNPYSHEEHRKNAQDAIQLVHQKIESGRFDILILDEINNAQSETGRFGAGSGNHSK